MYCPNCQNEELIDVDLYEELVKGLEDFERLADEIGVTLKQGVDEAYRRLEEELQP
ncbi:hypothetical protein Asulf_01702 [Archaeoglobus sulfaticallidus PM70-1]|uniref:Uncharacterized protein n=1 Tax=Archaeoglobus sulfaticallidus PM70-1 TaxID=387631 RepID=N0BF75_9EURY|nr:hypothetical protein [Archaeoglobus sulfaticallidus]AGK61673.1 hypothetical protein Asulf_01702 [Archaeoglobus sulfaticallidus PM70-1]